MKRVLVVDDSRSARMIFIRCLKIVGYAEAEFFEARDGVEALELMSKDDRIDLVLLDLNMPRIDGLKLVDRMKRDPRMQDVPIVVASSLVNDVLRARLFADGVHAVVEKPISPASLIAAVSDLLVEGDDRSDGIHLDETFDEAVSYAFEGIAFAALMRERGNRSPAEVPALAEPVWARIDLLDPPAGEVVLAVEASFARRLEELVTGAPSDKTDGDLELLGEISNALAGAWARRLAPEGERIALSLPRTGRGEWGAGDAVEIATYSTDERDRVLLARIRPVP